MALLWPGITLTAPVALIAAWALTTGAREIGAAVRLRREVSDEWLLALSGALPVLFGLAVLIRPATGAPAVVWVIGTYAILFGITMLVPGWRMRGLHRVSVEPGGVDRAAPV